MHSLFFNVPWRSRLYSIYYFHYWFNFWPTIHSFFSILWRYFVTPPQCHQLLLNHNLGNMPMLHTMTSWICFGSCYSQFLYQIVSSSLWLLIWYFNFFHVTMFLSHIEAMASSCLLICSNFPQAAPPAFMCPIIELSLSIFFALKVSLFTKLISKGIDDDLPVHASDNHSYFIH